VIAVPLPEDGPAEIAGVSLPAGQRLYGWDKDVTDIERPLSWRARRAGTSGGTERR